MGGLPQTAVIPDAVPPLLAAAVAALTLPVTDTDECADLSDRSVPSLLRHCCETFEGLEAAPAVRRFLAEEAVSATVAGRARRPSCVTIEASSSRLEQPAVDASINMSRWPLSAGGRVKAAVVLGRMRCTGSQNILDFGIVPHTACSGARDKKSGTGTQHINTLYGCGTKRQRQTLANALVRQTRVVGISHGIAKKTKKL